MKPCFCPKDRSPLEVKTVAQGLLWQCPTCQGRSISVAVMKRSTDPKVIQQLWTLARSAKEEPSAPCVHCRKPMRSVSLPLAEGASFGLEVCPSCYFLWCEPARLAALPPPPPIPPSLPRLHASPPQTSRSTTALTVLQGAADAATAVEIGASVIGSLFSLFADLG